MFPSQGAQVQSLVEGLRSPPTKNLKKKRKKERDDDIRGPVAQTDLTRK